MKIYIDQPFTLEMEVTELEEHLPSFKMAINLVVPHPTGSLTYKANDLWFESSAWQCFSRELSSLNSPEDRPAKLCDMSDMFILSFELVKTGASGLCHLQIKESDTGMGSLFTRYEKKLSIDEIHQIRRTFEEFSIYEL